MTERDYWTNYVTSGIIIRVTKSCITMTVTRYQSSHGFHELDAKSFVTGELELITKGNISETEHDGRLVLLVSFGHTTLKSPYVEKLPLYSWLNQWWDSEPSCISQCTRITRIRREYIAFIMSLYRDIQHILYYVSLDELWLIISEQSIWAQYIAQTSWMWYNMIDWHAVVDEARVAG